MNCNISFFTPVRHIEKTSIKDYVEEAVDDYFYLGGRVAVVIKDETENTSQKALIVEERSRSSKQVCLNVLKVISYTSIIFPLFLFFAKTAFRSTHHYNIHQKIANEGQKVSEAALPMLAPPSREKQLPQPTAATLMKTYTEAWDPKTESFSFASPFNLDQFLSQLQKHAAAFRKKDVLKDTHFGFIEKFDLDPQDHPKIYIRADLHGDLKSLIENLRTLQEEKLLDEHYQCLPGTHLVFLGDYCDRGIFGTQVLQLLMCLKQENPSSVHIIRGNHEYQNVNTYYGASDKALMQVIDHKTAREALEAFYETMPLTTYFSLATEGKREYVQCTHGLFEPTTDPLPLLDRRPSGAHLPVLKKRSLTKRVRRMNPSSPLYPAAKRIQELASGANRLSPGTTLYNWADVTPDATKLGNQEMRQYALSAKDIRHYLNLSSNDHSVKLLFRGHQHEFQHLMEGGSVIATTLPVGMDSLGYKMRFQQPDRAYLITPAEQVANWKKQAVLRRTAMNTTETVTEAHPLTSSKI